jgi:ABC-type multidrug transport system ATPase subunit
MTLCLDRVGKRYGRRGPWILDDVNLELAPETFSVVVGENGSGKSTLMRVIVGASSPSRGSIKNRPSRITFAPDRFVPPRMTVRTYLDHLGRLRGLGVDERRTRSAELAELLRIAPGLDAPLSMLSRGNAKKVALAQAFIAPADLVALDEPSAALDAESQSALRGLIASARERGAAVVVADHGEVPPEATPHRLVDGRLEGAG